MITNIATEKLSLSLLDYTNGYIVSDIEGLGPVKAELTTSEYALYDGARFQWAKRGVRNIVFTVDLVVGHPTKTVDELRRELFREFNPKKHILLYISRDGLPTLTIECYVESAEPSIFSPNPQVVVSLLALSPDFAQLDGETFILTGGSSGVSTLSKTFTYPGSSSTGFVMMLSTPGLEMQNGFTITTISDYGSESFVYNETSLSSPPYTLDTRRGKRTIYSGYGVSELQNMEYGSNWVHLYPGTNTVRFTRNGSVVGTGNYTVSITYPILESHT